MIRVKCPECEKTLGLDDAKAGKTVTCPSCQNQINVPKNAKTTATAGGSKPAKSKNTKPGRDHNPYGFSMWMAVAGVKRGFDYGQSAELGYAAVPEYKVGHSDIHATIQSLLGVDYKKNTFPYEGRDESLVGINPARIVNEVLV